MPHIFEQRASCRDKCGTGSASVSRNRTRSLCREPFHRCYSLQFGNEQAVVEANQRRTGTSHWQSQCHLNVTAWALTSKKHVLTRNIYVVSANTWWLNTIVTYPIPPHQTKATNGGTKHLLLTHVGSMGNSSRLWVLGRYRLHLRASLFGMRATHVPKPAQTVDGQSRIHGS